MKKVLFTLVLLATAFAAQAQDNYHDALKAYVQASPSALAGMGDNMDEALRKMNEAIIKDYKGMTSQQLISKYTKEQMIDDIIDNLMIPVVEKNATIAEINELTAAMSSRAGKTFQEHQKQINSNTGEIERLSQEAMQTIMDGNTPKTVTIKSGCPQSYVNLYYQYFGMSGLQSVVAQMGNMFGNKKDTPEVQKFLKYMEDNMQNIYLNMSYGVMTTDDLKFGMKVYKSEAWKHMMKATSELLQNSQSLGMGLVMSYIEWLKGQGVTLKM